MIRFVLSGWMVWLAALQAPADLDSIRKERDLTRRYQLALDYANEMINKARRHYGEGMRPAFVAAIEQVEEAVALCDATLRMTGKNPSKNPRHFKRAELKIRELLRRLGGLEQEVAFDDREVVGRAKAHIGKIHDELLLDIMGSRK